MSHSFQYAVLRYMPDAVTQEFVNIGVLLFSHRENYLKIHVSHKYKRVSQMFDGVEPLAFRRIWGTVEKAVGRVSAGLEQPSLFEERVVDLETLLRRILPENDASLSFSKVSSGITDNLDNELDYLYQRLVEYYLPNQERTSRTDDEVWLEYVTAFKERNILPHLGKVTIPTNTFSYTFEHAFKNERWHPVEPVSFDLSSATYIEDKAARWIGKAVMLSTSDQIGTLYILSGKPRNSELIPAYDAAKRGLEENTQGIDVQVIDESEVDSFSEEFEAFITEHSDDSSAVVV